MKNAALILVDIQHDFVPGGALAVHDGDKIVPLVNKIQEKFDFIVATQDWHGPDHGSFAVNHVNKEVGEVVLLNGLEQVLWPVHCVQDTFGAAFVEGLDMKRVSRIFRKGANSEIDSYSGFFDNDRRSSTGMGEYLEEKGVEEVFIVGLATDYCVMFTALDARRLGFKTQVIIDACRGVNLLPDDVSDAIREMQEEGVEVINSSQLLG